MPADVPLVFPLVPVGLTDAVPARFRIAAPALPEFAVLLVLAAPGGFAALVWRAPVPALAVIGLT